MAYTAVIEARRAAEDKFQILAEGLRMVEERQREIQAAKQTAAQAEADKKANNQR